jgi:hypothetical protein
MLGKVIPTFEAMYKNFDGAKLPADQGRHRISRSFIRHLVHLHRRHRHGFIGLIVFAAHDPGARCSIACCCGSR